MGIAYGGNVEEGTYYELDMWGTEDKDIRFGPQRKKNCVDCNSRLQYALYQLCTQYYFG